MVEWLYIKLCYDRFLVIVPNCIGSSTQVTVTEFWQECSWLIISVINPLIYFLYVTETLNLSFSKVISYKLRQFVPWLTSPRKEDKKTTSLWLVQERDAHQFLMEMCNDLKALNYKTVIQKWYYGYF